MFFYISRFIDEKVGTSDSNKIKETWEKRVDLERDWWYLKTAAHDGPTDFALTVNQWLNKFISHIFATFFFTFRFTCPYFDHKHITEDTDESINVIYR